VATQHRAMETIRQASMGPGLVPVEAPTTAVLRALVTVTDRGQEIMGARQAVSVEEPEVVAGAAAQVADTTAVVATLMAAAGAIMEAVAMGAILSQARATVLAAGSMGATQVSLTLL
jgi:hypothetical protein